MCVCERVYVMQVKEVACRSCSPRVQQCVSTRGWARALKTFCLRPATRIQSVGACLLVNNLAKTLDAAGQVFLQSWPVRLAERPPHTLRPLHTLQSTGKNMERPRETSVSGPDLAVRLSLPVIALLLLPDVSTGLVAISEQNIKKVLVRMHAPHPWPN